MRLYPFLKPHSRAPPPDPQLKPGPVFVVSGCLKMAERCDFHGKLELLSSGAKAFPENRTLLEFAGKLPAQKNRTTIPSKSVIMIGSLVSRMLPCMKFEVSPAAVVLRSDVARRGLGA